MGATDSHKTAHTEAHNALVISCFMRHKDKKTSIVCHQNEVRRVSTNCVELARLRRRTRNIRGKKKYETVDIRTELHMDSVLLTAHRHTGKDQSLNSGGK